MKVVAQVVKALIDNGAVSATKFVSPREVVRATRRRLDGRVPRKGSDVEVVLKVGRPNWAERQFIKACQKAGEPFPVRKIRLRLPAKG